MFLGHFAVGLALKRVAPRTSLGILTAAAEWLSPRAVAIVTLGLWVVPFWATWIDRHRTITP